MKLYDFQEEVLNEAKPFNRCAFYYEMGLGKTYIGSEKAVSLGKNILVICQKSKVNDWYWHFRNNYNNFDVFDMCHKIGLGQMMIANEQYTNKIKAVGVINYELAWRRKELEQLCDFTLMLDESSLIQNETTKQAKFILNKLNPSNVILLSGTPVNGKYEQLWSQCNLLGWKISKELFYRQYLIYERDPDGYPQIVGYKNVERLKAKLRQYGAFFKKSDEVINLPARTFIDIKIPETSEYKYFKKHSIVTVDDVQLVGDTTLTAMLYSRQLCSQYNKDKLAAFEDLLESTNDRLIVFYNFWDELYKLEDICIKHDRPVSIVNGQEKDLSCHYEYNNSVTLIQYKAGAYGLNLQKANKIIYFSPPISYEQFDQSKKRIHRIGQEEPCWYYLLKSGIDYRIYDRLALLQDYTDELYKEDSKNDK